METYFVFIALFYPTYHCHESSSIFIRGDCKSQPTVDWRFHQVPDGCHCFTTGLSLNSLRTVLLSAGSQGRWHGAKLESYDRIFEEFLLLFHHINNQIVLIEPKYCKTFYYFGFINSENMNESIWLCRATQNCLESPGQNHWSTRDCFLKSSLMDIIISQDSPSKCKRVRTSLSRRVELFKTTQKKEVKCAWVSIHILNPALQKRVSTIIHFNEIRDISFLL